MNPTRKKPYPMRGWTMNAMLHAPPAEGERIDMVYDGGRHICTSLRHAVDVFDQYCRKVALSKPFDPPAAAVLYRKSQAWAMLHPGGKVRRCVTGAEMDVETQRDKS